jgi:hypothetical protein
MVASLSLNVGRLSHAFAITRALDWTGGESRTHRQPAPESQGVAAVRNHP